MNLQHGHGHAGWTSLASCEIVHHGRGHGHADQLPGFTKYVA